MIKRDENFFVVLGNYLVLFYGEVDLEKYILKNDVCIVYLKNELI